MCYRHLPRWAGAAARGAEGPCAAGSFGPCLPRHQSPAAPSCCPSLVFHRGLSERGCVREGLQALGTAGLISTEQGLWWHSGDSVSLSPLPEWQETCADGDKESSGAADRRSTISFAIPFLSISCRTASLHGCAGSVRCGSGSWVGQLEREQSEGPGSRVLEETCKIMRLTRTKQRFLLLPR